jgi:hypothetical protein
MGEADALPLLAAEKIAADRTNALLQPGRRFA